jgi:hypothetical protein
MNKLNPPFSYNITPPRAILPVLQKLKITYILWHNIHKTLPKIERYSLGKRIDGLFVEAIESVAVAVFLSREEKQPYVRLAIRKIDTLKIFLMILWETKSLDSKKYIELSQPMEEIGKMLGGWLGQLQKQNSPAIKTGEKQRE